MLYNSNDQFRILEQGLNQNSSFESNKTLYNMDNVVIPIMYMRQDGLIYHIHKSNILGYFEVISDALQLVNVSTANTLQINNKYLNTVYNVYQ